jgi:hypothetical protein
MAIRGFRPRYLDRLSQHASNCYGFGLYLLKILPFEQQLGNGIIQRLFVRFVQCSGALMPLDALLRLVSTFQLKIIGFILSSV